MKHYEKHVSEKVITELNKLIGGAVFYMSFPYVNIHHDLKKISFESGTITVSCKDFGYKVTFMSEWSETFISYIDCKEFIINIEVTTENLKSCTMNYALTDPNRESKVTFKASSIRSVLVYKSIIEAPDETVDFDSHIIFILENGRAIIFEVEIDLTDTVNMIITDSEKIDKVIGEYKNNYKFNKLNISERIRIC